MQNNLAQLNYPVGFIGNLHDAKQHIENELSENDDVQILDANANIDDIKQFRVFLLKQGINRRVGVIYGLNKWSDSQQAILLKLFEELPSFNKVFYASSFLPNFVIVTRSYIIHLKNGGNILDNENILAKPMQMLFNAMCDGKDEKFLAQLKNGWKILVQAQSWFVDSVIAEKERDLIFKSVGLIKEKIEE